VFQELTGIAIVGTADELVDMFAALGTHWAAITRPDGIQATKEGNIVVAGLKSSEHSDGRTHGHVAVVVDGELYRGLYPKVWCGGGTQGRSNGSKSVGEVWSRNDRDNVKYFRYDNF
jgi:hypothetical protein